MTVANDSIPGGERPPIPRLSTLRLLSRLILSDERRDMGKQMLAQYREHGPIVMQSMGRARQVYLFGPDANRLVLMDRERIFSARRPWTQIMGRIFPNGLLLRDGDEHKHHRKIMHEAFKRPALRDYAERMNPRIESGIADWQGDMKAFPAYKTLTLDIAASIFLGEELGPGTAHMNGAFEDMVAASMSLVRLPIPGLEFQRGLKAREFMVDYIGRRIAERRAGGGGDMFSRLSRAETEDGRRFADQDVIDHMSFLMMAAHDTTTSTLTSMTYLLARHQDWQERLRAECLAHAEPHLAFDAQDRLPLVGQAMRETLRLYPPLPVIPRTATASFEFGGYEVPEGAMVVVAPVVTHYMDEWWEEPERFDPGRFSPERAEDQKHSHMWVPFGGGPHMCIGLRFAELQVKCVMHQLLRRVRFVVAPDYEMPVQQAPISKPVDGLPVRMEPLA